MARNLYKVPKEQWKNWSKQAQKVFNSVYKWALPMQLSMHHPKLVDELAPFAWKTLCWNFAWVAADAIDDKIPDIIL